MDIPMERMTIDEIIGHCERHTERCEVYSSRMQLEETPVGDSNYMKEYWEHRQVAEYLKELKQYRALGPVGELEEDALMVRADRILLDEYMKLGSVEECRKAVEKQIAKKPKHVVEKYGKHKWQRKKNGEIDDFAWDYGYHNGVVCEVCGESVCVHCEPDYDNKEDCEKSYYVCPTCGEITFRKTYCDCGQKLDWREE